MKRQNRSLTKLMLALPASGLVAGTALANPLSMAAQTITPTELVGSWLSRPYWQVTYLEPDSMSGQEVITTYGADNVIRTQRRFNGKLEETVDSFWHWALHGDTLLTFSDAKDTLPTRPKDRVEPGKQLVARKGDQLIVMGLSSGACTPVDTARLVVDLTKLPPPPAKPPITVDPAALAGTWARSIEHSDTLVLGADKTARVVTYFDPPRRFRTATGTWKLYPEDIVVTTTLDTANKAQVSWTWPAVTVQGQLVLAGGGGGRGGNMCFNPKEMYQRVSP